MIGHGAVDSRARTLVALMAAGALLVTACGGNQEATSTTAAASTTTAAPTTTAVASDDVESTIEVGRSTGTLLSAGLSRDYVLHIPTSYDDAVPVPVVMVFHGYTMTAEDQTYESRLPALGELEGFITVFPEGRGEYQRWLFELDAVEIDISMGNADMTFVSDLLDMLEDELAVDSDRIYAVGFSNGGWMASAVACTLSNRFAAAAPVAGIMDFGDDCAMADPVPLISFHGTSDQYEPFEGGTENAPLRASLPTDLRGTLGELPVSQNPILELSVPEKVARWADGNGCEGDPVPSTPAGGTTRWVYPCSEAPPVVLYEIAAGTHQWNIAPGFDTNAELWSFLSSQSR